MTSYSLTVAIFIAFLTLLPTSSYLQPIQQPSIPSASSHQFYLNRTPFVHGSRLCNACNSNIFYRHGPMIQYSRVRVSRMQARGQSVDEEDDDPVELKIEAPVYRSNFQARKLKQNKSVKKKSNVTSQRRKEDKQTSTNESAKAQNNNNNNNNVQHNVEELPLPNEKLETDLTSDEDSSERDLFLEDTIEMLQSYSDSPFFLDTQQAEEYSIDSFLRGDYDRPFAEDAPAPYPKFTPSQTVQTALESLRNLDDPEPSHGAAVFLRFLCPLSRNDRWGGSVAGTGRRQQKSGSTTTSNNRDDYSNTGVRTIQWKEILRGALNPTMLARRLRASNEFSILLDWNRLDVTDGMSVPPTTTSYSTGLRYDILGLGSTMAFVNAALYFGNGTEPSIVQFTLRKINGVWLIDDAVVSKL